MQAESSPARPWRLTRWAVWALPARVVTSILLVELTAFGLFLLDASRGSFTRPALFATLMLCVLGVAHTEIAVGLERLRRQVTDTPHGDLSSVWTFAGAILLPPALATVVVLVIFTHQWFRVWRSIQVPVYRHAFSTATVVLACHAAAAVLNYAKVEPPPALGGARELLTMTLAILAYATVNTGLVAAAIALSAAMPRPSPAQLIGHWDDNMLELATLCLGALAALALASNPWLVVLVMAPLLVLHRAVLVRQLEEVASTDSKTGLLNAAAWHTRAAKELRRAQRGRTAAAVLIMDLDHFKSVNDDHGHLAGDEVLSAVASALRAEVREHDLVGRFGGEEFVVLLPELGRELDGIGELHAIAERIRHRISTLSVAVSTPNGSLTIAGLSVSVGGAKFPDHGAGLEKVLEAADEALYVAKRNGRNAVRIAEISSLPRQRTPTRRVDREWRAMP
jgi:diguanylate cyclase (GGDEF)-like protein